ncbi:CDP-6-deoxy-delta-3,4-glucoseen reductase [Solemya pervernicosa gill symbiont]|uniref:CDP-6-deoxy-delta-3,4-glucoseen reductase n=2 Tax=Gammaproteobacteria incertae sedis TaxID=118884 RepID=A0A1T2L5K3_9GAMM|nr:CDP-6-deoxy-delta-3,4-glucoseen reductase [Candidatus Reidiella endopervernicosa]OOZ40398.1 CDP-6-deoxy-delta-3,4-glucoseen reductase [Solemya pervernicosa gill symbiont]QKQ25559.1 CDP-6-deoxy-delta-3,4-glucoseen reductase [Candidatus Reidiella endopervernicosa]
MSFKVTVEPSGHEFTPGADEAILDAALNNGLAFPYGCRNGACGACKCKKLSGDYDYGENEPMAITPDEQADGIILTCQAIPRSDMVLEVKEITSNKEIEVKNVPCRVESLDKLSHDVIRMILKMPDADEMQFLPGQYIDILLEDGRRRAFSIANAPRNDSRIELHIRHVEGGDYTGYIFNEMKEKEIIRIEGPHGTFFLREDNERPIVLMGGGTGFAPLKGILEHCFDSSNSRPVHLFWGVRAKEDLYMNDVAEKWANEYAFLTFTSVLSEPKAEDNWEGKTGFVHEAVAETYPDLSGHDVYMSGPPAMIHAAKDTFVAKGLSLDNLFSDSFDFANDK